MDSVVHLRAAVSLLGRFPALAGVDLDVAPTEIVLVRGPNGAGKTTLLRLCAGLARLSSGEATVLGCDLARDSRAVRARVGLLGHATALYDDLSVVDNVRFWSRAAGARVADTEEAIEQLGLGGRLATVPVAAPLGRSAPPGRARDPRRPTARAVAPRRAARGPRRDRPGSRRRPGETSGFRGRHRAHRLP